MPWEPKSTWLGKSRRAKGLSVNLLKRKPSRLSLKLKRYQAGLNNDFLLKILAASAAEWELDPDEIKWQHSNFFGGDRLTQLGRVTDNQCQGGQEPSILALFDLASWHQAVKFSVKWRSFGNSIKMRLPCMNWPFVMKVIGRKSTQFQN